MAMPPNRLLFFFQKAGLFGRQNLITNALRFFFAPLLHVLASSSPCPEIICAIAPFCRGPARPRQEEEAGMAVRAQFRCID